jgi:hypothetical protein
MAPQNYSARRTIDATVARGRTCAAVEHQLPAGVRRVPAQEAGEQHAHAPALGVLCRWVARFLDNPALVPQSALSGRFPLQILRVLGRTGLIHILAKLRIHDRTPFDYRYQCLLYLLVKLK